jgi:hypothetical protein
LRIQTAHVEAEAINVHIQTLIVLDYLLPQTRLALLLQFL